MSRRWISSALVVALACKPSGTGPKTIYTPPPGVQMNNPQAPITGIAAFEAAWTSPAIRSSTGISSAVALPAAAPARAPQCGAGGPAASPFSTLGVIPDSDFGRIFVYDSATARFRAGPTSGGPAGGVEFIMPAVDSLNRVIYPEQGVGTLDLFDVTSGGPLTMHTVITGTGSERGDYTVSDSGTSAGYAGVLSGRVAGAGRTFTFVDTLSGLYQQLTANATVSDSGHGAQMRLIATRTQTDQFDNFYDLDFTYTTPGQRVKLHGNITTYCLIPTIGLTVTVNDSDFALVNTGTNGPVITSLADSALTPAQDSAIRALIRGQNELFSWLNALAQPTRLFLP
jgi:hypothetical protein